MVQPSRIRAVTCLLALCAAVCTATGSESAAERRITDKGCIQVGTTCVPILPGPPGEAELLTWLPECEGGDPDACRAIGDYYWYQIPERRSESEAFYRRSAELLEKRCAAGRPTDCEVLANLYRGNPIDLGGKARIPDLLGKAAALRRAACDRGAFDECYFLAISYEKGEGVKQNVGEATTLLQKACDGGSAQACSYAGYSFFSGKPVRRDHVKAARYLSRACELGEASDCLSAATIYRRGDEAAKNLPKAAELYQRACDSKDMDGCYELALMLAQGEGVAQDVARAAELMQRACHGGATDACKWHREP